MSREASLTLNKETKKPSKKKQNLLKTEWLPFTCHKQTNLFENISFYLSYSMNLFNKAAANIHVLHIHVLQIQSMFYKSNPVLVLQHGQPKI